MKEACAMHNRMKFRILVALVFTLLFACLAAAHEVIISDQAKLGNGPSLEPGTYRIELVKDQTPTEVLFYKEAEVVLRAPVTLAEETEKSRQTEVHSEDRDEGRVITRIRVKGWTESLVFE
jgi:hypothetical protein